MGFYVNAQRFHDNGLNDRIIAIAEQYIGSNDGNIDFDTYLENLEYYANHPMNLNKATQEDLSSIGVLNGADIQKILDYRERLGEFVEVLELILTGVDRKKVESISLFFTVKQVPITSVFKDPNFKEELSHQVFLRYHRVLEERKGFSGKDPSFLGDANKYYLRYAVNYQKQLQAGFVLEKDDGEQFFRGDNKSQVTKPWAGFDYSNAYLGIKSKGIFKTTVLGAYSLHLGQGLVSWSGLGIGKTVFALESKKIGELLKSYTSVNEYAFYRGVASQIKIKKFTLIPYFSHRRIDANAVTISDSADFEIETVSSIQKTGSHRTSSEIEDEKAIKETIMGLSIGAEIKELEIRGNYQFLNYSSRLESGSRLYQRFNFSNDQLHVGSIDYRYSYKKITVFGEHARQSEYKQAHLVGAIARLDPKLDVITIYRNYSPGYYAVHANGFGEGGTTSNEKGLYVGVELKPKRGWDLNAYIDYYDRPWLTFNTSAPSTGTDVQLQLERNLNDQLNYYFRFKHELNQLNSSFDDRISKLSDQTKWRFRYHLNLEVTRDVRLKTRLEFSGKSTEGKREVGTLFYQDVRFSLFHYKLDLTTRVAYFNTPSFSTAIYAYENDVLYSFSVPAYFNQGTRYYVLASFDLTKNIQMWVRFSRWLYTDTNKISSGNTEIEGDTKSELKVQMRMLF